MPYAEGRGYLLKNNIEEHTNGKKHRQGRRVMLATEIIIKEIKG